MSAETPGLLVSSPFASYLFLFRLRSSAVDVDLSACCPGNGAGGVIPQGLKEALKKQTALRPIAAQLWSLRSSLQQKVNKKEKKSLDYGVILTYYRRKLWTMEKHRERNCPKDAPNTEMLLALLSHSEELRKGSTIYLIKVCA